MVCPMYVNECAGKTPGTVAVAERAARKRWKSKKIPLFLADNGKKR